MRALVSFTLQRNLRRQHAQNATFGLFAAASLFRFPGWFHIHLFLFIYSIILDQFLSWKPKSDFDDVAINTTSVL